MSVVKNSAEIVQTVIDVGVAKSKMTFANNILMGILAGAYIGFGSILAIKCAGNLPAGTWGSFPRIVFGGVFPVGLLLVLLAGADLFTGDCMFMPSALVNGKIGINKFFRILILSIIGNFLGSFLIAWLTFKGGLLEPVAANYAVTVANGKAVLPFGVAFIRGIMCNWLVCLAIFVSLSATDGVSKAALMWPPIFAFVALGMEHSVANMTFMPLGILIGSSPSYIAATGSVPLAVTWGSTFINNLVPVVLGNFIGGALFVCGIYYKTTNTKKAVK